MKDYDLIFEDSNTFADYRISDANEALSVLPKFNLINIIIGANNSGKSRFLRHLMSKDKLFGVNCLEDTNKKFQLYDAKVLEINEIRNHNLRNYVERSKTTTYLSGVDPNKKNIEVLQKNSLSTIEFDFENAINIANENKKKLYNLREYGIKSSEIADFSMHENFCRSFSTQHVYWRPKE